MRVRERARGGRRRARRVTVAHVFALSLAACIPGELTLALDASVDEGGIDAGADRTPWNEAGGPDGPNGGGDSPSGDDVAGGDDGPAGSDGNPSQDASDGGVGSADACAGGTAVATGPGCQGLPPTCGPNCNASCCGKSTVAAGTFSRCYDAVTYTDNSYTATVSAFPLDTYEVTVGRFRPFVAGYPGDLPSAGAGKNPHDSSDPGWDTSWNALMPPDQATLTTDLHCHTFLSTWSAAPSGNENKPLNCVSWFEAYAFCIWDGGRLPTEAEWNYAAAGGSDQRVYPWSIPPTSQTIDGTYANFDLIYSGATRVGEFSPRGDGRWGQADLAGNVWEWTLDWYANPFAITPCTDCADLTSGAVDAGSDKVLRGASFYDVYQEEVVSNRGGDIPGDHYQFFGFRCAR